MVFSVNENLSKNSKDRIEHNTDYIVYLTNKMDVEPPKDLKVLRVRCRGIKSRPVKNRIPKLNLSNQLSETKR